MPIWFGNSIYIHMPKTGGSWVSNYLVKVLGGVGMGIHGHAPASAVPLARRRNHYLWGTIRDPWSWYLSWWAHGMQNPHLRNRLILYGAGSTAFRDVLIGALSRHPGRVRDLDSIAAIWDPQGVTPEEARRDYLKGPGGLYSWVFRHMYGDLVKILVDTKRLYEGLEQLFGEKILPGEHPPVNVCGFEMPPARKLYDSSLTAAVGAADKELIDLFGYQPFSAMPEAVWAGTTGFEPAI